MSRASDRMAELEDRPDRATAGELVLGALSALMWLLVAAGLVAAAFMR